MTVARRSEWTLAGVLALESRRLQRDGAQLRDRRQRRRDRPARRGGRPSRSGAHADRHRRRHRSVVGIAARARGRRARRDCGVMRAGRSGLLRRRRSAWAQRAARLNAWFVARWRLPPLMVTLGSLSLFRGLAEGLTGGVDNYTGLPPHFLALGQGFAGPMPMQAPVLIAGSHRDMATRAPHHARPRVLRHRATTSRRRALRASTCRGAWRSSMSSRDSLPGSRLSSTSRTSGRPRPMRARDTS